MLLKDIGVGQSCVVEHMDLPFQVQRRLEALGMTRRARVSVVNRVVLPQLGLPMKPMVISSFWFMPPHLPRSP